jgi:hypothetical protein
MSILPPRWQPFRDDARWFGFTLAGRRKTISHHGMRHSGAGTIVWGQDFAFGVTMVSGGSVPHLMCGRGQAGQKALEMTLT